MSEKRSANAILASHGPAGWLVRTLQKYSLLGWGLFLCVLIGHFGLVGLSVITPKPVVAVDSSGRVLGVIEYLKPTARSDEDIKDTAKRFTALFLSLNSETIFEDYAQAMNMMDGELLQSTKKALEAGAGDTAGVNYLVRVAAAKARSWVEVDGKNITILEQKGMKTKVRVVGEIVIQATGEPTKKPFDITYDVETVARNSNNTSGLAFIGRKDN